MRILNLVALIFALAMLSSGATFEESTVVLGESFTPTFVAFPGGNISGYTSSRQTLYNQQSTNSYMDWFGAPWFDPTTPWFGTNIYSNLSDLNMAGMSLMLYDDLSGNSGTGNYLHNSVTNSTISSLSTTFYPLESRSHIAGQKYQTRYTDTSSGLYSFDCRDLAGRSGACAGTDKGSRTTIDLGLGGIWFSFDLNVGDGSMYNFDRGDISSWMYTSTENWDRSWPSQPFNGGDVPEPETMALMGIGLMALYIPRRYGWRPSRIRAGLPSRSGK